MKKTVRTNGIYIVRKICVSVISFSVCVIFFAASVMTVLAASEEEAFPLLFRQVTPDRKEAKEERTLDNVPCENMDEAWESVCSDQDFDLYIGQRALRAETALVNNEMYVGAVDIVREFIPDAGITESEKYVSAVHDGFSLEISPSQWWITVNGRYLKCDVVISDNGTVMIPLVTVSRIFVSPLTVTEDLSCAVFSESEGYIRSGEDYYGESRLYWLSRIISAESRGESIYGKIAVGNVVMNRVESAGFPGTVYDVIFDTECGVQFTPAVTGAIFNEPDSESVIAAKLCLEGVSVSDSILFFINPDTASDSWVSDNRTFVTAIGNHEFYS